MLLGEKALEDGEGAVSQEVEATVKEGKPVMSWVRPIYRCSLANHQVQMVK
jgi:hypothetical protein